MNRITNKEELKETLSKLPRWKKILLLFGRPVFSYSENIYGHGMLDYYIARCSCGSSVWNIFRGTYFVGCLHGDYPLFRTLMFGKNKTEITKTGKVIKTSRRLECPRCKRQKFITVKMKLS